MTGKQSIETIDWSVSEDRPGLIIFLIDQSGSMTRPYAAPTDIRLASRADIVSRSVQTTVKHLLRMCLAGNECKRLFYISVLGYGDSIAPLLRMPLMSITSLVPKKIRKSEEWPALLHDLERLELEWYTPKSMGEANIALAYMEAKSVVDEWNSRHTASPPAVIINITDGQPATWPTVRALRSFNSGFDSRNRVPLLFNCLLSDHDEPSIMFPDRLRKRYNQRARLLCTNSSILPPATRSQLMRHFPDISNRPKGFAYNPEQAELELFLNAGVGSFIAPVSPRNADRPGRHRESHTVVPNWDVLKRAQYEHFLDSAVGTARIFLSMVPPKARFDILKNEPPTLGQSDSGRFIHGIEARGHVIYPPPLMDESDLHALRLCFDFLASSTDGELRVSRLVQPALCKRQGEHLVCIQKGECALSTLPSDGGALESQTHSALVASPRVEPQPEPSTAQIGEIKEPDAPRNARTVRWLVGLFLAIIVVIALIRSGVPIPGVSSVEPPRQLTYEGDTRSSSSSPSMNAPTNRVDIERSNQSNPTRIAALPPPHPEAINSNIIGMALGQVNVFRMRPQQVDSYTWYVLYDSSGQVLITKEFGDSLFTLAPGRYRYTFLDEQGAQLEPQRWLSIKPAN